jgi:hypothetical protein
MPESGYPKSTVAIGAPLRCEQPVGPDGFADSVPVSCKPIGQSDELDLRPDLACDGRTAESLLCSAR